MLLGFALGSKNRGYPLLGVAVVPKDRGNLLAGSFSRDRPELCRRAVFGALGDSDQLNLGISVDARDKKSIKANEIALV